MYNHAPDNYKCPICLAINGIESQDTLIRQSDIVYKNELVIIFVSPFFIGNNPGHIIIAPNKHFENIYDIHQEYLSEISGVARKVALLLKESYKCDGISTLQNNEPAGGQHAFHYHFHVFPRYKNDELHKNMLDKQLTTPEQRLEYVGRLKGKI